MQTSVACDLVWLFGLQLCLDIILVFDSKICLCPFYLDSFKSTGILELFFNHGQFSHHSLSAQP